MNFFKYFEEDAKKNISFHDTINNLIDNIESNEAVNELLDFILDPQSDEAIREERSTMDSGASIKKIELDFSPETHQLFVSDYKAQLVDESLSVHNKDKNFLFGLSVDFLNNVYSSRRNKDWKPDIINKLQYSLKHGDKVWGLNDPFTDEESFVSFIRFSNKYPNFFNGLIYSTIFNGFFTFLLDHCQNDFYKAKIIDIPGLETNEMFDFLYNNRNIITHGRFLEINDIYRKSKFPIDDFDIYARKNVIYIFSKIITRLNKQDLQNEKLVNWLIKQINQALSFDDRNHIKTLLELLQTIPEFKEALRIIKTHTSANIEIQVGFSLDMLDLIYEIYQMTGLEFYSRSSRKTSIYMNITDVPNDTITQIQNLLDIIENKEYLNITSFDFYLDDNDSKYFPLSIG